jgi:general secretion pathway protein M
VRSNARALPGEARLARNASGGWDGTLLVTLPAR